MIIAITATGTDLGDQMDPRFGRGRFYIIYNMETNKVEKTIDNENVEAQGGAGTSAAQIIANENVEAMISGNFGPNAAKGLKAFGIEMYTAEPDRIQNIISKFKKNELSKVEDATVAGHH